MQRVESIILDSLAADPGSPENGQVWFNTTDGEVRIRQGGVTKAIANPATPTQVKSATTDPITSVSDVLVAGMTQTPAAGNYKVSFSTSANLGANSSNADFSIYVNGVQEAESIRQIARGGGATTGHIHNVAISEYLITVAAGSVEIRASVSAGTLSVFQRNMTLTPVP
jgi:hypothetical protein